MLMNRTFARRMEVPVERAQAQISRVSSVVARIDRRRAHREDARARGRRDREARRARRRAAARPRGGGVRPGRLRARARGAPHRRHHPADGAWARGGSAAATSRYGTLVQFVSLFYLLSWPMRFIGWILGELPRAVVGKARVDEVLATPITVAPPPRPVALPDGPLGVEVQALTYRLRRRAGPQRGRPRGPPRRVGRRRRARRAPARACSHSCWCAWTTRTRARS